jgi:hypothetical protein
VTVSVKDSNGGAATSGPFTFVVAAVPGPGPLAQDEYLLIGVGALVLAAAAILVVWAIRRRGKSPPSPSR